MSRPRLLFLSQCLPYPPDTGAKSRTYQTLRQLARGFEISALCFYRRETLPIGGIAEAVAGLREIANVTAFPIPQEYANARRFSDHARSVLYRKVYTRYTYFSRDFRNALREEIGCGGWSVVHVDSLDLACYRTELGRLPCVCVHHDVQSQLLERRGELEGSWARRVYLRWQAARMREEETAVPATFDLNVVVSDVDAMALRRLAPSATFQVIPNGVDTDFFQNEGADGEGIVFVGGADWFPNRDAMEYFAAQILPLVRRTGPDVPVTWVGRVDPSVKVFFEEHFGIKLTGRVDDIRPLMRNAACVVVPLRAGSGTRVKILDAWAMGKAVVSTSLGCEGLEAIDGRNILVRNSPDTFASAISDVLRHRDLRSRLGDAGRQTATRFHDWRILGEGMLDSYRMLAESATRSQRDLAHP